MPKLTSMLLKKISQLFKRGELCYKNDLYKMQEIALLTKHEKERVIAPLLHDALGAKIKVVEGYDTDKLGTFSREIPRALTQIEAARKKAKLALELSSLSYAVASEGSFGVDPISGIFALNVEYLLWIDQANEIEIVVKAEGRTNLKHALITTWEECEDFAKSIGFESHHLILRPQDEHHSKIYKGLTNWQELKAAFHEAQSIAKNHALFIETDMRANANPTRMQTIERATQELIKKLSSLCPSCNAPGYGVIEHLYGLECGVCHNPTQEIYADVYGCIKCKHTASQLRNMPHGANPAYCDFCNP